MFSDAKTQPKDEPKFQYIYDASEYFLGEIILGGFAIKF